MKPEMMLSQQVIISMAQNGEICKPENGIKLSWEKHTRNEDV